jgi:hypothetical protein
LRVHDTFYFAVVVYIHIINILCADIFRPSAVFGCFVFRSFLLHCVIFSSILNCMFNCTLFRYRNLFSFSLVYQFQSVQFCHTLFNLLPTFLSIMKCISSICISYISFHLRKAVLRVKFQDWQLQRAYQDHLSINNIPITKKHSLRFQSHTTIYTYFILAACFGRLTIIRPSLQNSE